MSHSRPKEFIALDDFVLESDKLHTDILLVAFSVQYSPFPHTLPEFNAYPSAPPAAFARKPSSETCVPKISFHPGLFHPLSPGDPSQRRTV
jgi:hypothetical protein